MAIGTALAIGLGSAVLGAGATMMSASKNSKAINKSTDAQTASTAANNALQRDIFGQNKATLSPFVQGGVQAGSQLNAMLGLGGQQAAQQVPTQQPNLQAGYNGGYGTAAQYQGMGGEPFGSFNPAAMNDMFPNNRMGRYQTMNMPQMPSDMGGGQQFGLANLPNNGVVNQQPISNPGQGFADYIGNSDFAFQQQEGNNAINSGYAGSGTLQSGAAMRGLEDYRQNLQSGYRNEYMGYLGQQQGVGLQAAGAQAGVGINYANATSANNQNQANALSNAAVARANNSSSAFGSIASGVSGLAGNVFNSGGFGGGGGGAGGGSGGFGAIINTSSGFGK
jgi:hypothetical protein